MSTNPKQVLTSKSSSKVSSSSRRKKMERNDDLDRIPTKEVASAGKKSLQKRALIEISVFCFCLNANIVAVHCYKYRYDRR